VPFSLAQKCGSPPSFDVPKEETSKTRAELKGEALALSKYVGSAEIGGQIERERTAICQTLEKPDANRLDQCQAYIFA
jgi:hypothetical protein